MFCNVLSQLDKLQWCHYVLQNRPGTANSGSHQQAQPWVRWVSQSTVSSPLSNIKGKGTAGRTLGNAAVLGWGQIWLPNHAAGVVNHVR